MRHPTSGKSEDDLSRLTGSLSSTSSTSATPCHNHETNGNETAVCEIAPTSISSPNQSHENQLNILKNSHHTQNFNSSYLPQIIDPLEWQKSRKRKERLDSTSSITQERKLVRSNSEELIPNADCEVIRRVSSQEDFKKPLQEISDENVLNTIQEGINDSVLPHSPGVRDVARRSRQETSPARSQCFSPSGEYRRCKDCEDSEYEHERRRSNERFCKSRAPPGRKSGIIKKSNKFSSTKFRGDENLYKYDISALKHERRGFVSKFKLEERSLRKEEAADGEQIRRNDYNDNNLIDFRNLKNDYNRKTTTASSRQHLSEHETPAEALPWDCTIQEDQTPVLCRRFADYTEITNATDQQPQTFIEEKYNLAQPIITYNEPVKSFRTFSQKEDIRTREVMQQSLPSKSIGFQTAEERLKYVNKKLTALKKRVVQLEGNFENNYGYRPSQVEKFNDKQIKTVLTEISKLRKEKYELKSDPLAVLGLKVTGGMDNEKKLQKMKETLADIQKKLAEKREEFIRPECLDELTADQLIQEKTAVQHGLLYLESLFGRPTTKDERDAARPLYDRYRVLKRMVTRNIAMSSSLGGTSDLPTILEHEAMAFTYESAQQTQSTSTDTTTSSVDAAILTTPPTTESPPTDNFDSVNSEDSNLSVQVQQKSQSRQNQFLDENIHTLNVDELWQLLERLLNEKKQLKQTIKEYETLFEKQNGRKMLKSDRKSIEDTFVQYKERKAKVRLLQALIKKHISR